MATTTNDGIHTVHDDAAVDAVAKLQPTPTILEWTLSAYASRKQW